MKAMNTMKTAMAAAILLSASAALAAPTPAAKCQAGKGKLVGQYYACRQKADAAVALKGGTADYSKCVTKFDEIAIQFPTLRMSLEHVGGYHFFNEALAVIFNNIPFPPVPGQRGRVYGGLTSCFTPHYVRFWYMSRERFEELLLQVGPEYLIFGLDFPYNLEENTRLALTTIKQMIPLESARELVLGGNLRRELGIPRPV